MRGNEGAAFANSSNHGLTLVTLPNRAFLNISKWLIERKQTSTNDREALKPDTIRTAGPPLLAIVKSTEASDTDGVTEPLLMAFVWKWYTGH